MSHIEDFVLLIFDLYLIFQHSILGIRYQISGNWSDGGWRLLSCFAIVITMISVHNCHHFMKPMCHYFEENEMSHEKEVLIDIIAKFHKIVTVVMIYHNDVLLTILPISMLFIVVTYMYMN